MSRFFNTAGLCMPGKHYMVNPLNRLRQIEELIRRELYFTLHAPRQTGKTTYLYALAQKLNSEKKYISLVVSFEQAGYQSITVEKANDILVDCVYRASCRQLPKKERPQNPETKKFLSLNNYLGDWAAARSRPIVLLIDEIDALLDDVLIAVLRQLRDGYQTRPTFFPSSVVLVGLRDVRDYKAGVRSEMESWGTASPFNVKSDSLFLDNFSRDEVFELLGQHGEDTGQVFPLEVKEEIYRLSGGQPWLTNALADQIVFKILDNDFGREIVPDLVMQAKDRLITRRDTHLDSLVDKLKEKRVKRIVQAVINGDNLDDNVLDDDIGYVRDLGIVSRTSPLQFANPIYAEIIPRVMASPMQESIPLEIQPPWFVDADGNLDMDKVLGEFQSYYRRNSGAWLQRYEYRESAHHLLLMAFLQRVVNSGGRITREMAVGNGRMDMLVQYGNREYALELKIKWEDYTIDDGKEQLYRYLDGLGLDRGYLVVFDPGEKDWEQKVYRKETVYKGKTIIIVGL